MLTHATGINERGVIVAYGHDPEPHTHSPGPGTTDTTTRTSCRSASSCSCQREAADDDRQASGRARAGSAGPAAPAAAGGRSSAGRRDRALGQADARPAAVLPGAHALAAQRQGDAVAGRCRLGQRPAVGSGELADEDDAGAAGQARVRPVLRRALLPGRWTIVRGRRSHPEQRRPEEGQSLRSGARQVEQCAGGARRPGHERRALVSDRHDARQRRRAGRLRFDRHHRRNEHAAAGVPGSHARGAA